MSTQHTPGIPPLPYVESATGAIKAAGNYGVIATLPTQNAALSAFIIRACNAHDDMLAVLIDAANALGELLPSDHPRRAVLARANAVIDKAEGQSSC